MHELFCQVSLHVTPYEAVLSFIDQSVKIEEQKQRVKTRF